MEYELIDRVPTLEEYNTLRSSVGWRIHPDDAALPSLEASIGSVVALQDSQIVGMARAVGDCLYAFIVDVVVHTDHQGTGVGKLVVTQLREQLRRDYPSIIGLIAEERLSAFYRGCGFEPSADPYFRAT